VVGAAGVDHEGAVDLLEDEDAGHEVGEGEVGELPADVGAGKEGFAGAEGACDDEDEMTGAQAPGGEAGREGLAGPLGAVQVEEDDEVVRADLFKSPGGFFVFGLELLAGAVVRRGGFILQFQDFSAVEGLEAFEVFFFKIFETFVFALADAEDGDHAEASLCVSVSAFLWALRYFVYCPTEGEKRQEGESPARFAELLAILVTSGQRS